MQKGRGINATSFNVDGRIFKEESVMQSRRKRSTSNNGSHSKQFFMDRIRAIKNTTPSFMDASFCGVEKMTDHGRNKSITGILV